METFPAIGDRARYYTNHLTFNVIIVDIRESSFKEYRIKPVSGAGTAWVPIDCIKRPKSNFSKRSL